MGKKQNIPRNIKTQPRYAAKMYTIFLLQSCCDYWRAKASRACRCHMEPIVAYKCRTWTPTGYRTNVNCGHLGIGCPRICQTSGGKSLHFIRQWLALLTATEQSPYLSSITLWILQPQRETNILQYFYNKSRGSPSQGTREQSNFFLPRVNGFYPAL